MGLKKNSSEARKKTSHRRQLLIVGDREDVAFGCQSVGKETHGIWGKEGGADEEEDWCRFWHVGHQTEGCRSQTTVQGCLTYLSKQSLEEDIDEEGCRNEGH
ncbi:hypothetical protein L6452_16699 [Arctium lappa]|uniref:Uncharacterized protein n=1 Tax=Arctium lappa TaxID=4217 RepID=A0ACB9C183_ARCLA|nr:hypothetical protein L6452_16699 [Arctium lappa]